MKRHEIDGNFFDKSFDMTKPYISISTAITLLGEPFDSDGVAQKTVDKHFNNPESQYYQKTKEEILNMWEAKGAASRKYGCLLDDYIGVVLEGDEDDLEMYNLDNDVDGDTRLNGLVRSFTDFKEYVLSKFPGLEYVGRERTMYYDMGNFLLKGRFDALFYDNDRKKWIIVDWKSSGTIDKTPNQWTKNLLGPARVFPALNWYTYTIQTYFYKTALLTHYLPEGTDPDDIEVWIVNLPGTENERGNWFGVHLAAFKYDKELLDNIFNFAFKKNEILRKKEQLR